METFKFKNINSNDLGIIVKEMPPIIRAERDIESIEITGRNGNLYIDNNTYKSKKYKINCILTNLDHIDELKALYLGKGKLELSTEPNREYDAVISNKIDISKYLQYLKEFPLEFELNPIAYSISEKIVKLTESKTIIVDGNTNAKLKLIIFGRGEVTINNISAIVNESDITIDCDLMNCTKNNINKNDKVELEEFPFLKNGENTITLGTGITKVEIIYKEGWL